MRARPAAGGRWSPGLWMRGLRDRLPLACLLCGTRAAGGLCRYCRDAVCASMAAGRARCPRCDLALPDELRHPAHGGTAGEEPAIPGPDRLGLAARLRDAPDAYAASGPACPDCSALSPSLQRVVAAFDYAWPGELLIHRLKLHGRFGCAPVLAAMLAERCREAGLRAAGTAKCSGSWTPFEPPPWGGPGMLVTAVPASRRSLVLRGYNPAAEVGRALARRLGLAWRPALLRRVREGSDQKGLGRHDRRRGVEGLYRCVAPVDGREVLVVDDVMTTGSTLEAIARELKENGALRVWGAVAARTPRRAPTSASV